MSDSKETAGLFIFCFFVGIIIGSVCSYNLVKTSWRNDAVKTGHAEWIANDFGAAVWQWKKTDREDKNE